MTMKDQLEQLSKALKNVHKQFLENERIAAEIRLGHALPPLAFFHLLTQDPSFVWMKPFASTMAELDEFIDKAESITATDVAKYRELVEKLVSDPSSKIAERYRQHLMQDSGFVLAHAELRLALDSPAKPQN